MSNKNDDLGDRMKAYEARGASLSRVMPGEIMIARLDGRTFSKFTRSMARPYDVVMSEAMGVTMLALVKEFGATIGYTQSDEITLVWVTKPMSEIIFGGRVQKIVSSTAADATAEFNDSLEALNPGYSRKGHRGRFDCRVFTVPSQLEALNCLLWRQQDATKNAISMAARSVFSHNQLRNKSGTDMKVMLAESGINFNDYPEFFKRGVFGKRVVEERYLTEPELSRLPEHAREKQRGVLTTRSKIELTDYWIKFERTKHQEWCDILFNRQER